MTTDEERTDDMSNDITAPGRSALWTQAALAAIQGFAANSGGLVDMAAIAERAMTTADTFERRCIERHEREQAEERERQAHALAEAEEKIRRVGRYRVPFHRDPNVMGKWVYITMTVDTVKDGFVTFHPHPEWNQGEPRTVSVQQVLDEDAGFIPMPLTYADFPTIAPDALPTAPGMADADALLRAAMAERGKTAG